MSAGGEGGLSAGSTSLPFKVGAASSGLSRGRGPSRSPAGGASWPQIYVLCPRWKDRAAAASHLPCPRWKDRAAAASHLPPDLAGRTGAALGQEGPHGW